ncbi:MAG: hypothetical protein LBI33_12205, partial [Propionibacteriaceae bacterium]|nr:hypothetical protein [Propionibacteriaceae bacterium]
SSVAGFDPSGEAYPPALTDLPANAVMAMGTDGTACVVDPQAKTLSIVRGGAKPFRLMVSPSRPRLSRD